MMHHRKSNPKNGQQKICRTWTVGRGQWKRNLASSSKVAAFVHLKQKLAFIHMQELPFERVHMEFAQSNKVPDKQLLVFVF